MFASKASLLAAAAALCVAVSASAQTTYTCNLTGAAEVPANASPATGSATVVLNAAQNALSVSVNFANLTTAYTASHIHGPAPVGSNASVKWGFVGAPAGWVFSNGNRDGVLTNFAVAGVLPADVANLNNGLMYVNIHSSQFPGGEIRGQLLITTVGTDSKTWSQVKSLMR